MARLADLIASLPLGVSRKSDSPHFRRSVSSIGHRINSPIFPTVWAVGEVVQEEVHFSAAKLQPGSFAVWMGMYAPVTQMRAAIEAGHDRLGQDAGVDAEPIPELEFDQTLGW